MSPRKIVLLAVAAIIALTTVMLTRSAMQQQKSVVVASKADMEILVASRDLPAGTLIKEIDLKWQPWPSDAKGDNLIARKGDEKHNLAGAVVRAGLKTGEPVTPGRILRPGEQGFLSALLEPGKRAISLRVTPVTGVAGLVFPGDRVDVILTHQVNTGGAGENQMHRVSETVIKDVRVLALDQKIDDQSKEAKLAEVVTLEVDPKDAEKVVLMAEWGTMALSLRGLASEEANQPEAAFDTVDGIPLVIPGEENAASYTWDSDISGVLPGPKRKTGNVQSVRILRGKEAGADNFGSAEGDGTGR